MSKNEENVNSVSRISAGTAIAGEIYSVNDLRIDGSFEGHIFSKGRIVIGEGAVVNGDVICTNLDLWGKMTGNVYVKDTLSLKSCSSTTGNINIKKFVVELGALFDGTCKMISDEEFQKIASEVKSPVPERTLESSQDSRKK